MSNLLTLEEVRRILLKQEDLLDPIYNAENELATDFDDPPSLRACERCWAIVDLSQDLDPKCLGCSGNE